jgi:hypothetical protein
MAQTGELGYPRTHSWENGALAVVVRAEAEKKVLGQVSSPPLDPAALAAARGRWQEVKRLLDSANQHLRRRQWLAASDDYAQVLAHPGFDWEVSELAQDFQAQCMGVVFVLAGNQTRHRELARALASRNPTNLSGLMRERYATAILCSSAPLPPDLLACGVAWARESCPNPQTEKWPWLLLARGMAEYRDGRYEEALAVLARAQFGDDKVAQSRVLVFQAMACSRVGRTAEAREMARQAETALRQGNPPEAYWNSAFAEIALQEVRALLTP